MDRIITTRLIVLAVAAVLSTTTFAQKFEKWEGKPAVLEGEGGTKEVIDGVEFWKNGTPPRKHVLLGYIEDRRQKTGLAGKVRMAHLQRDVAAEAKKAGGDAVILIDSEAETVGFAHVGNTHTNMQARASGNNVYASGNSFGGGG